MIAVRRAKRADADEMGRIYVETWQDTYPGLLPDEGLLQMSAGAQAERWRQLLLEQSPKDACLVATHAEYGVVGLASAGPTRTRDLPFGAEVFTLYVDPNHQRLGAGRALLKSLFTAMHQAGQRSALIWALGGNPNVTFYERMGGREVGRRFRTTFGARHEEIAYGWPDLTGLGRETAEGSSEGE